MSSPLPAVVVSAVSICKGGTLTQLRTCLACLSEMAGRKNLRVVAVVHSRELVDFPHIKYVELPRVAGSWPRRLWCEYRLFKNLSLRLAPVGLWFSFHDTTPRVRAARRAVYYQTSFSFMRPTWRDVLFDYKIPLFCLFARYAYRIGARKNDFFVVQTEWLRRDFAKLLRVSEEKFIVAPPAAPAVSLSSAPRKNKPYTFIYPATPDCHKNFETLLRAAEMLEERVGREKFCVRITLSGRENRYARWLYRKWSRLRSVKFEGFLSREQMRDFYSEADCLVFPSRVETWGLPISEFAPFGRPMLLADLSYAHETAASAPRVAFFPVCDASRLAKLMQSLICGDSSVLSPVAPATFSGATAKGWEELVERLLAEQ